MNMHLYEDLERLSIAEKRMLGEALIMSAESEASAPLVTEAQRTELRSRLAYHRANHDEQGMTFAELKAKLLASSHYTPHGHDLRLSIEGAINGNA